jgi:heme exporter protein B
MRDWLAGTWAVFEKDVRLELRSRYAVSTLVMFVLGALLLVGLAVAREPVAPRVQAALLWVVILLGAAVGLGRAFVSEVDGGTELLLRLNTRPSMVYAGKLLFTSLLIIGVNAATLLLFVAVLQMRVEAWGLLALVLALGAVGLAGTTTLLAALIARTSDRGPMLPVLLFPLLVPLLMTVSTATRGALEGGGGWAGAGGEITTLVSFAGVIITVSVMLFDYVWVE